MDCVTSQDAIVVAALCKALNHRMVHRVYIKYTNIHMSVSECRWLGYRKATWFRLWIEPHRPCSIVGWVCDVVSWMKWSKTRFWRGSCNRVDFHLVLCIGINYVWTSVVRNDYVWLTLEFKFMYCGIILLDVPSLIYNTCIVAYKTSYPKRYCLFNCTWLIVFRVERGYFFISNHHFHPSILFSTVDQSFPTYIYISTLFLTFSLGLYSFMYYSEFKSKCQTYCYVSIYIQSNALK